MLLPRVPTKYMDWARGERGEQRVMRTAFVVVLLALKDGLITEHPELQRSYKGS